MRRVDVAVDYELEGQWTRCRDDAVWHFNIHPEHMYDLWAGEPETDWRTLVPLFIIKPPRGDFFSIFRAVSFLCKRVSTRARAIPKAQAVGIDGGTASIGFDANWDDVAELARRVARRSSVSPSLLLESRHGASRARGGKEASRVSRTSRCRRPPTASSLAKAARGATTRATQTASRRNSPPRCAPRAAQTAAASATESPTAYSAAAKVSRWPFPPLGIAIRTCTWTPCTNRQMARPRTSYPLSRDVDQATK